MGALKRAMESIADDNGISFALTPVQLYAMLNGKSISQGELASNTWHEMPSPPLRYEDMQPFLGSFPGISSPRSSAWAAQQTHFAYPNIPGDWTPSPTKPRDERTTNRTVAVLQLIGGGLEVAGGVVLLLVPEPTTLTKFAGGALTVHGTDTTQAAIRQLFSGRPVQDFTQMGGTWAARQVGASDKTAHRVGVILDVAVPIVVSLGVVGASRIMAIRAGRIILSEDAVAGKVGRISLDVEEADKAVGKEGGHTLERHVNTTDADIEARALRSHLPDAVISRFASKQIAEDAINDAIRANRSAIQRWAANPSSATEAFEFQYHSPIGNGFFKATGQFQQLSKVRVVFKIARYPGKLLYIGTAYPVP
jgi:hypothetical protein